MIQCPNGVVLRLSAVCLLPLLGLTGTSAIGAPVELRVGTAGHAFDHLGSIGDQAEAAAASGASIIYVTGLGALGYQGLPPAQEIDRQRKATAAYLLKARHHGIRLALGYVCATSLVNMDAFDRNWSKEFRARFHTPPATWRQQDRDGNPLPSWYGGQYTPACMNNPDWLAYERFVVRQQLESGCDGIFFDNPTVHPQGCFCPYCMEKFGCFLHHEGFKHVRAGSLTGLRKLAQDHPDLFMQFRCTIARDFLADMRLCARAIKPGALVTANNSLNSSDVLYAQCRNYAYNIHELSRAEDFVVVEDMSSQPRMLPDGRSIEYGPTYKQLQAISHGKPLVAVTLAEGDYHTPPNLVRLAMAEAAANGASYLSWPTWPENERARMAAAIRPQAEFLRSNADLLNDAVPRRDVIVFLPFHNWLKTSRCRISNLAAELTRANIQYEVICEDALRLTSLRRTQVLLVDSLADLTPTEGKVLNKFRAAGGTVMTADAADWLAQLQKAITRKSVLVHGPPTVRAAVRDQHNRTILHMFNLDIQRLSSFEDKVTPVRNLHIAVRVPLKRVRSVRALTADAGGAGRVLEFSATATEGQTLVETSLPQLDVGAILVVE